MPMFGILCSTAWQHSLKFAAAVLYYYEAYNKYRLNIRKRTFCDLHIEYSIFHLNILKLSIRGQRVTNSLGFIWWTPRSGTKGMRLCS